MPVDTGAAVLLAVQYECMTASWHRVRQFGRALTARVRPEEHALVRSILPEPAVQLFQRMSRQDQRHGLDVVYCLHSQGKNAPELLAAALLHDVAKVEGVGIWHRVLAVLVGAACPTWLPGLAAPLPTSWRYPLWLQAHHPQRGAELAMAAGCADDTVELIRHHHDRNGPEFPPPLYRWLVALQAADDKA